MADILAANLFCLKSFIPVARAEVFIWENFHPGHRDPGHEASLAPHMNTSKFLRRKEWRGDKIIDEDVF